MIAENDTVVLTVALPENGLLAGDVGAVVHVYTEREAYEVEFVAGDGSTLAVLTLHADMIRRVAPSEVLHVREVPS